MTTDTPEREGEKAIEIAINSVRPPGGINTPLSIELPNRYIHALRWRVPLIPTNLQSQTKLISVSRWNNLQPNFQRRSHSAVFFRLWLILAQDTVGKLADILNSWLTKAYSHLYR